MNNRFAICSICGNEFMKAACHMYKKVIGGKVTYQCSYTCYRKAGGDDGKYGKSKILEVDPHMQEMWKKTEE